MLKTITNKIFLAALSVLTVCGLFFSLNLTAFKDNTSISYADSPQTYTSLDDMRTQWSSTPEGIPYLIYICDNKGTLDPSDDTYTVVNNNDFALLSSHAGDDDYNSTVHFVFGAYDTNATVGTNGSLGKSTGTANAGNVYVQYNTGWANFAPSITVGGINISPGLSLIYTNANIAKLGNPLANGDSYLYYDFPISLNPSNLDSLTIYDTNNNAVAMGDLSGTWTFSINYAYNAISGNNTTSSGTQASPFTVSFNIVDFASLNTNSTMGALSIVNADGVTSTKNNDYNSQIPYQINGNNAYFDSTNIYGAYAYNFDYANGPVVGFDASKFAVSFVQQIVKSQTDTQSINYTSVYTQSGMEYSTFMPGSCTDASGNPATGRVTVYQLNSDGSIAGSTVIYTYPLYTYLNNDTGNTLDYYAKDTDGKYILDSNGQNIPVLYYAQMPVSDYGDYTFSVQLIVPGSNSTYPVAQGSNLSTLSGENKNLTVFGYMANYYDQSLKGYQPLTNNSTQANAISSYTVPDGSGGTTPSHTYAYPYTSSIPTTNQAPIKFSYYGTLTTGTYYTYTSNETALVALGYAIPALTTPTSLPVLSGSYGTYAASASFTVQNVYIVQLTYSIEPAWAPTGSVPLSGTQYVVFSIDNTIEQPLIETLDPSQVNNIYSNDANPQIIKDVYTNQYVRLLMPYKNYTFNTPLKATYWYADFSKISTPLTGTFQLSIAGSGYTTAGYQGALSLKKYAAPITGQNYANGETPNQDGNSIISLNGGDYNYLVISQNANLQYTFPNNPSDFVYVTLGYGTSGTSITLRYVIDSTQITGVTVDTVGTDSDKTGYFKGDALTQQGLLGTGASTSTQGGDLGAYDMVITDQGVTVFWTEKAWAASLALPNKSSTNVSVYRLPFANTGSTEEISALTSAVSAAVLTNGLTNGFATQQQVEPVPYQNSVNADAKTPLAADMYLLPDGVYLFFTQDFAGNYFYRMVMIDNTQSSVLQASIESSGDYQNSFDPTNTNPANFVHSQTQLIFGTQKLIGVDSSSITNALPINAIGNVDVPSFLTALQSTSYFASVNPTAAYTYFSNTNSPDVTQQILQTDSTGYGSYADYLAIPIKSITYSTTDTTSGNSSNPTAPKELINTTLPNNQYSNGTVILYEDISSGGSSPVFCGEQRYMFRVTCINNSGDPQARQIEMNFDNTMGQFSAYNSTSGAAGARNIPTKTGTNFNVLEFSFTDPSGNIITDDRTGETLTSSDFAVKSITYKYYAFNYDASVPSNSTNYPFASLSNPTLQVGYAASADDLDDSSYTYIGGYGTASSNGFYNLTINNADDGTTLPGEYIFTRTYAGGPDASYGRDTYTRTYIVYVDLNGIISTTYMDSPANTVRQVGDNISFTLGYNPNNTSESYTFTNFFRVSSNNIILTTNRLPVYLNIPTAKYLYLNKVSGQYTAATQNFANLNVQIAFDGGGKTVTYTLNSSNGNFYNMPAGFAGGFTQAGTYTITISDNTGYYDAVSGKINVNPTTYSCKFIIQYSSPYGTFSLSAPNSENPTPSLSFDGQTAATNAQYASDITFSFSDPTDPYSAKVTEVDITKVNADGSPITNGTQRILLNQTDMPSDQSAYSLVLLNSTQLATANGDGKVNLGGTLGVLLSSFTIGFGPMNGTAFESTYYQYVFNLQFTFGATDNCIYTITLKYSPDPASPYNTTFKDWGSAAYTLIVDHTRPVTNISTLLSSDTYLTNSNNDGTGYYTKAQLAVTSGTAINANNKFIEENAGIPDITGTVTPDAPTIYDYTFGLNTNFILAPSNSGAVNPDTLSYFYVKQYNKYNGANIALTPDNPAYNSLTMASNYPRFNPAMSSYDGWYTVNYSGFVPLASLIYNAYNNNLTSGVQSAAVLNQFFASFKNSSGQSLGFFQIIECDRAGNYRTYTVYFGDGSQSYDLITLTGATDGLGNTVIVNGQNTANVTVNKQLQITGETAFLGWSTLTLTDASGAKVQSQAYKLTPYTSSANIAKGLYGPNSLVNQINSYLQPIGSANTQYKLNLNTPLGLSVKNINTIVTGQKFAPPTVQQTTAGANTYYYLTYTAPSVAIYLTDIRIYAGTGTNTTPVWPSKNPDGTPINYTSTNPTLPLWLQTDANGLPLSSVPLDTTKYVQQSNPSSPVYSYDYGYFPQGVYTVVYTDNYNGPYQYVIYVGADISQQGFTAPYTPVDNSANNKMGGTWAIYGSDVAFTYQSRIYGKVNVSVISGATVPSSYNPMSTGSNLISNSPGVQYVSNNATGYYKYNLLAPVIPSNYLASDQTGGVVTYVIDYFDLNNTYIKSDVITIFNELPALSVLSNVTDLFANMANDYVPSVQGDVAVTLGELNPLNDTNIPLFNLSVYNLSGGYGKAYAPLIYVERLDKGGMYQLSSGGTISEDGYYRISLFNSAFGDVYNSPVLRSVTLIITSNPLPFYTLQDASKNLLIPSPISLIISSDTTLSTSGNTLYSALQSNIANAVARGRFVAYVPAGTAAKAEQYYTNNLPSSNFADNSTLPSYLQLDTSKQLQTYTLLFINGTLRPITYQAQPAETATYITLIYGTGDFVGYTAIISVTKVPASNSVLASSGVKYQYTTTSGTTITSLSLPTTSTTLTQNSISADGSITLVWNTIPNYIMGADSSSVNWYMSGDVIQITYGYAGQSPTWPGTYDQNNTSSATVSGSGLHTLAFTDWAGNNATFGALNSRTYQLTILDQVIYTATVTGSNLGNMVPQALNYGTFNNDVTINLDSGYRQYYSGGMEGISLTVTKNGQPYVAAVQNNSCTFSDSGRYQVTINANYSPGNFGNWNSQWSTYLKTSVLNFVIIDPTSARLAYEQPAMQGYTITQITKAGYNGDIKNVAAQNGDLITSGQNYPLGNGVYTITLSVQYDALLAPAVYSFTFKINDTVPLISSTPSAGGSTTGTITLLYNSAIIYQELGTCTIKVKTYNSDTNVFTDYITPTAINLSTAQDVISSIKLNTTNSYYVQLVTASGNVVSSFRVDRNEPLNTIAIIVIVVASLAVAALIVVFIRLRTRMKVR